MLPVRAPIQVTLEDTGGPQVHCIRRGAPVKILRRPHNKQPQQAASSSCAISNSNTICRPTTADPFKDRLFLEPSDWPKPGQEWPQLKQASQQQQPQHLQVAKKSDTLYSAIHTKSHQPQDTNGTPTPNHSANNNSRHLSTLNNKTTKPPLKTYQERADEYAKARLRILGSAFPDDQQSGDQVDVNAFLEATSIFLTDSPAAAGPSFNDDNNPDNNNCSRSNKLTSPNNFYPDSSNRTRQSR